MNVTLLGPQRRTAAASAAVSELMPPGPVATINAGWQEREADSVELDQVLGGRMRNLELHRRWQELLASDAAYALAERRPTDLLAEMQSLYVLRLRHAMDAVGALARRGEVPAVQYDALVDAIATVQSLDDWHLRQVAADLPAARRRRPGRLRDGDPPRPGRAIYRRMRVLPRCPARRSTDEPRP